VRPANEHSITVVALCKKERRKLDSLWLSEIDFVSVLTHWIFLDMGSNPLGVPD
jgi:hypothetical protein